MVQALIRSDRASARVASPIASNVFAVSGAFRGASVGALNASAARKAHRET